MISEQQQEEASLYVLGALTPVEREAFIGSLRTQPELRSLVFSLERAIGLVARALPSVPPPPALRDRILRAAGAPAPTPAPAPDTVRRPALPSTESFNPAYYFASANDPGGWKELPVRGAFLKLLTVDRDRGYAVLLGRLNPGVRYPAHSHRGAENVLVLTGDLTIGNRRLGPGDFHHCDAGTSHPVNSSEEGCTLFAVLDLNHELVRFAMAT